MKKLLWGFLLIAFSLVLSQRAQAQVVVIANRSVKTAEVSKDELRDVFTGNSSTLSGSHVLPVLLNDCATHEEFLSQYIGKTDAGFRAGWRSLLFSGQANMPKGVSSESAVLDYVAATPGAIGYVDKAIAQDRVKILRVK